MTPRATMTAGYRLNLRDASGRQQCAAMCDFSGKAPPTEAAEEPQRSGTEAAQNPHGPVHLGVSFGAGAL